MRQLWRLWLTLFVMTSLALFVGCPDEDDDDDDTTDDGDDDAEVDCHDEDEDGWNVGPDCPGAELQDCDDEDADLNWDDVDEDGFSTCDEDCDDDNADVYPDADEVCNGEDEDCDGDEDEDFDNDGDGFVDGDVADCAANYDAEDLDCDDTDDSIHPGAWEVCNGIDDDCDTDIDEDNDLDGDGVTSCGPDGQPDTADDDCVDTNPDVYPGAKEVCNHVDDNCDGVIDEGFDNDKDGYTSCSNDCDDNDATVYIGAKEVCDGVDNDCDTLIDEESDGDNDGWTVCGPDGIGGNADDDCDDSNPLVNPGLEEDCDDKIDNDCDGVVNEDEDLDKDGYGTCDGDCNDSDDSIYPGANETCNGIDDDCDGDIDEDFDGDKDGYTTCGADGVPGNADDDCDDTNPNIHPGAIEDPTNKVDDDCDGIIDESPFCNPWDPIEAIGATKTFDTYYPMFGADTETVEIVEQTTWQSTDVYRIHSDAPSIGVSFDYYVWCDPAVGEIWKYGMEATIPKYGSLVEMEDPYRVVFQAPANVGVVTAWQEKLDVGYEVMSQNIALPTVIDYTDLGIESITVPAGNYNARHIHAEATMTDPTGYVGDIMVTYDQWYVEEIGLVRFWYDWTNPLNGGGWETLFTKEMASVTMP